MAAFKGGSPALAMLLLLSCFSASNTQSTQERNIVITGGDVLPSDEGCISRGFQLKGFMLCPNGRCIPRRFECDGVDDCGDGHDENSCPEIKIEIVPPVQCSTDEFQCMSDGGLEQCIPLNRTCDQEHDCADNADEGSLQCSGNCSQSEFLCRNGRCVSNTVTCDNKDDCGDGSDEDIFELCPVRCEFGFQCANRRCIPSCCRCNGINDCGDNSDELECFSKKILPDCPKHQYRCGESGHCQSQRTKCDKVRDCESYFDEDPAVCQEICENGNCSIRCKSGEFACANGIQCVPDNMKCDDIPDCADGSDESRQTCEASPTLLSSAGRPTLSGGCSSTDGRPGQCMNILECPEALALARIGKYPQICPITAQFSTVTVCCPFTAGVSAPLSERKTLDDFSTICGVSDPEPFILPSFVETSSGGDCMTSVHPQVSSERFSWCTTGQAIFVGGQDVPLAGFTPWMATLGSIAPTLEGERFINQCGGTLITDRHIVTAAHCAASSDVTLARLGELDLADQFDSPHVDVKIKRFHTHPGFRFPQIYNDIGVVELETPLTFNRYIRPACLPPSSASPLPVDTYGMVSGFGTLAFGGRESDRMQFGWVPSIDRQQCQQSYTSASRRVRSRFPNGIDDTIFCAGLEQGGLDACQGDSGSGFLITTDSNATLERNSFTLYGVVTAGIGCGSSEYPGLYIDILHYLDFIRNVTDNA